MPSPESLWADEGALNERFPTQEDAEFFGTFLQRLRGSLRVGGSELGLGMMLFSLAVSIRAARVVEIGRFKGFSTLALAGAMRFNAIGWEETKAAHARPDVDYTKLHADKPRKLISIDKYPMPEARQLIEEAGLLPFVEFVDADSTQDRKSVV